MVLNHSKPAVDEVQRLQGCINFLISVQAFAAIWSGQKPSRIIASLLELLVRMLDLDFAYARVRDSSDPSPLEMVRVPPPAPLPSARAIGAALEHGLRSDPRNPFTITNPIADADISVLLFRFGVQDEIGILAAASARSDFPADTEALLLRVAGNQAAIALQEARRSEEQKRASTELERGVVERTEQLTLALKELRREISERARAEEESRKLALLVERSSDFIAIAALDGEVLFLNRAGQNMVGLDGDEEARAIRIRDYVAEEDWPTFEQRILPTVIGEGRWDGEVGLRHFKTGAIIPVLQHIFLISDPGGDQKICLATVIRDISEPKRAEEELRQSEERFRLMVEGVKDYAIFLLDAQGRVTSWNAGAERLKGYRADEILGKHFSLLFPAEAIAQGKPDELLKLASTDGRAEDEGWRVRKDGARFWASVLITALRTEDGSLVGFSKLTRDITEQRQTEAALYAMREELARVSRVMTIGELTASIAHEVNQPLAGVVTNANASLRWLSGAEPNLGEARDALTRIIRDGKRASDVIARIRMLVKKTETVKELLDLKEAIQDTVALVQPEAWRRGVEMRLELAADLPAVYTDHVQIQQVLINLIMNGMEAMTALTDRPRLIMITTRRDQPHTVHVSVRDSGTGLIDVDRIFEAFYTTKPQGMGIGLSISRSIIEAQGGRLWAIQNDGPGATFQFTLPIYQGGAAS